VSYMMPWDENVLLIHINSIYSSR